MNEDYEETSEDEEAILDLFRNIAAKLPQNKTWFLHPVNYPRAVNSVNRIINMLLPEDPDITYNIEFDKLLGVDMVLEIKGCCFGHSKRCDPSKVFSLVDSAGILPCTDGTVKLIFGFYDVRILA